jgi:cephalosporin-C deacetylase
MPLSFDMPLEELRTYEGSNPRPSDFDEYWDQALKEMHTVDPQIELVPADFHTDYAECYHLYFNGVRDARIHAKFLRPRKANQPHPAVLMFHGYSMNSGDWLSKLPYVAQGYSVAALDTRGQGGLSQDTGGTTGWTLRGQIVRGLDDTPENMLFRHIFLDTAQLAGIVMDMPEVDESRVGATGGSQGGGLSLVCAALEPRIKRLAPTFPFLCDYKRVWDLDLGERAYEELKVWFRRFDPRHLREDEVFEKLGYIDVQFLCPRIKGDVLMAVGLMDQVCPPSTQFAAYNKITAEKSMLIYPDFAHEELPDHAEEIFQFMRRL